MRTIILTGVSKGLGKAMFDLLADQTAQLICIGRAFPVISKPISQEKISYIHKDLSESNISFEELNECVSHASTELVFINNAATIDPISKIGNLNNASVAQSVSINYLSPLLLTNTIVALVKHRQIKLHIINISSGAADKGIAGWSLYCSTKSAVKMFYTCLSVEEPNITISHIDPGVMDTNMQHIIRESASSDFPRKAEFVSLKSEGKLASPQSIATKILKQEGLL